VKIEKMNKTSRLDFYSYRFSTTSDTIAKAEKKPTWYYTLIDGKKQYISSYDTVVRPDIFVCDDMEEIQQMLECENQLYESIANKRKKDFIKA
jgi:hypothetical protein